MRSAAESGPWKLRTKFAWFARERGLRGALRKTVAKLLQPVVRWSRVDDVSKAALSPKRAEESGTLNLQAGDWVRVRRWDQIEPTLDRHRRHRGLIFMDNMKPYCGKTFRVMKVVKTLRLEETCEYRSLRSTVLLENVFCDGEGFYDCDRSCFHFWREVWLERLGKARRDQGGG